MAYENPRNLDALRQVAPDKSSTSALHGGLYVALSFHQDHEVTEALQFARQAPDGDSVAAVTGAILGACHGYEALTVDWLSRLELGWAMDRLARDLTAEVTQHQPGPHAIDPWWDSKYPGE